MNKPATTQRFKVGDVVRVVDIPYENCLFGWVYEMNVYCGREMTVSSVIYDISRKIWSYRLRNCEWAWCENCFDHPAPDIEESDADISLLMP